MLELAERLGFNLTNTFTRDRELLAHFLERVVRIHTDPEAHAQNALFTRRKAGKNAGDRFLEVRLDRRIDRNNRVFVLDEIASFAIFMTLRTFSSGMESFSAISSGVGSRP